MTCILPKNPLAVRLWQFGNFCDIQYNCRLALALDDDFLALLDFSEKLGKVALRLFEGIRHDSSMGRGWGEVNEDMPRCALVHPFRLKKL